MTSDTIEGRFVEVPDERGVVPLREERPAAVQAPQWSAEELATLKGTLAQGTTDLEFQLFVSVARRQGLDPFARQIYAVKRQNQPMTIQTSIDGFRLLAQRSGKWRGIRGPWWCGADGEWREVWLAPEPPEAAKVEVIHADYADPVVGIARWGAYVQTTREGRVTSMWDRMGDHMLAKCAEALALRRAFPAELSGLYTDDEMGQAGNTPMLAAPSDAPQAPPARSAPPAAQSLAPAQRSEPRPPAPRQAPPRAGLPPTNAPAVKSKPSWGEAFKAALAEHKIGLPEVAEFLGTEATTTNIQEWLDGGDGRTVTQLAADAGALAGNEAKVESGEISPDDQPF